MPSSLIRVVGVAAVLLAATVSGDAQGLAPRAQPVPQAGMLPGRLGGNTDEATPAYGEQGTGGGDRIGAAQLGGDARMVGSRILFAGQFAGQSLTATGALLKVGGLTPWAGSRKVRATRIKADRSTKNLIVDFKKITETGDVSAAPGLRDVDRIFVSRRITEF